MKIHPTSYPTLGYTQLPCGTWRIVHLSHTGAPPCCVGPTFTSSVALLDALPGYAARNFGYPKPVELDAHTRDLLSRLTWNLRGLCAAEDVRREGGQPCERAIAMFLDEAQSAIAAADSLLHGTAKARGLDSGASRAPSMWQRLRQHLPMTARH